VKTLLVVLVGVALLVVLLASAGYAAKDTQLMQIFLHGAGLIDRSYTIVELANASLDHANLRSVTLNDANLINANLIKADLSGAYLIHAHLSFANLRGADLSGAYLRGADLSGAYLRGAELIGADFSAANLSDTDLRGAYLSSANLSGADLTGSTVVEEQLSSCKSLEGATMPKREGWSWGPALPPSSGAPAGASSRLATARRECCTRRRHC